jgi:hypothetical protein
MNKWREMKMKKKTKVIVSAALSTAIFLNGAPATFAASTVGLIFLLNRLLH